MPTIKTQVHPPSGTIVLDRPQRRNALARETVLEISQALEDLHQQKSVRGVILTGSGGCFCAGMDLHEIHATNQQEEPYSVWHDDAIALRDLYRQMLLFPKPTVVAANGPALAAGVGLMLAADLSIAVEGAAFGFPEPQRGLVAGLPAPLLAFRLGGAVAARLLLTAETISAAEALRLHLIAEVVPENVVWARAHEIVKRIAQSAPEAIQLTKKHLNETVADGLETMLSAGAAASATSRTTEAAREGVAAFLEKREANWP